MMTLTHQGHRTMAEFYAYCDSLEERYNDVTVNFEPVAADGELHTLTLTASGDVRILYANFVYGEVPRERF